jgi:hypothetical protein
MPLDDVRQMALDAPAGPPSRHAIGGEGAVHVSSEVVRTILQLVQISLAIRYDRRDSRVSWSLLFLLLRGTVQS